MKDDYLLPDYLKNIIDKNVSKPEKKTKEKFADRESIIDEEQIIKVVNLFLK